MPEEDIKRLVDLREELAALARVLAEQSRDLSRLQVRIEALVLRLQALADDANAAE